MTKKKTQRLLGQEAELRKAKAEVRTRSRGRCEFCIPGVCTGKAQHAHHRQRRRADNHTPENLADVCLSCHAYVHQHPDVGYLNGWLVRSNDDPAMVRWKEFKDPFEGRECGWELADKDGHWHRCREGFLHDGAHQLGAVTMSTAGLRRLLLDGHPRVRKQAA
jgi:hypothetical protein